MALIDLEPRSDGSRKPGRGGGLLLFVVLAAAAAGVGYWLGRREPARAPAPTADATLAAAPAVALAPTGPSGPTLPAGAATGAAAPSPAAAPPGSPSPAAAQSGPRRISTTIDGPLEDSIAAALGPGEKALAAELTQVVNRLLVWSLQVSKDARKGDRIEVLFSPAPPGGTGPTHSQEPVVEVLRFTSQKLGRTFSAYRFQAPGARYPRYYREDGSEVEERLIDGPIREYEQVTSLVKDGRRHKGVDFRTPVGTPVYAPFDGVIERRNWKFSANGNCLDLVDPATGRHAIFLHLDVVPKGMSKGRAVKKGEEIAASGNSGRSTAPHLHYQLEDASGKVLDPYKVHRTTRSAIPAGDRAAFDAERSRLDARLSAAN
jgi:murein DD-endopeptidase MepM/ murein hydrolase activator NlpD